MKQQSYYLIIGALALAAIGYYVGSSYAMNTTPAAEVVNHDGHSMDHSDHMMVTNERDFLAAMVPHHQEAIDTATLVLERGGDNEVVRALARDIIKAQTTEITQMREWYEAWYGEPLAEGDYQPMMRDLTILEGDELNQTFLEDMIVHHQGAVDMAMAVSPYVAREEVRSLITAILTTQTAEITLMQSLLAE